VLLVPGQHWVVVERDSHVIIPYRCLVVSGREQVPNLPIVIVAPNEEDRAARDLIPEPVCVPVDEPGVINGSAHQLRGSQVILIKETIFSKRGIELMPHLRGERLVLDPQVDLSVSPQARSGS
jgi:hypothetical protein